ncbi:MAG: hypothetical protein PVF43_10930 [Candidatus Eiseniibacteriota bacterium]|jgi:2',3'-cyclic-nucleotide 2'-phosphodiesterase (5'-nucleotidase family)
MTMIDGSGQPPTVAARRMRRRAATLATSSWIAAASLVAALLAAGARPGAAGGATTSPAGDTAAVAPGDTAFASLNLIMTQSTEGELTPCRTCGHGSGGLARRAAFIRTCRDTADYVLLADGGNFRTLGGLVDQERDRFLLGVMEELGYTTIGIGEKDLRFGVDALRELFEDSAIVPVSANILDAASGEPVFAPYHVVEVGPIRVGFTGFLEPQVWEPYQELVPEVRVVEPVAALEPVLAELDARCELVVAFCQAHYVRVRPVLEQLEGLDIALLALRPPPRNYPRRIGSVEQVFYSGYGGRFMTWSRIEIRPGEARIRAGKVHTMMLGAPEDAGIRQRVSEFLGVEDPGDPAEMVSPGGG